MSYDSHMLHALYNSSPESKDIIITLRKTIDIELVFTPQPGTVELDYIVVYCTIGSSQKNGTLLI